MPRLHDLQSAFARAILHGEAGGIAPLIVAGGIGAERRLSIYRNTARITMTGALRLAFPAVAALVGHAFFEMAAARFQRRHPPGGACLNDYGAGFPDHMALMPETDGLPYLCDVGRFEWALSVAAHAPDMPAFRACGLHEIEPSAHASLRFTAHPSVTLLDLAFPADRIADAVLSGDDQTVASICLGEGPVHLAVHRGASGVAAERLTLPAFVFLTRLFAGNRLGDILDAETPDAAQILARQFTLGRLAAYSVGAADPDREIAR